MFRILAASLFGATLGVLVLFLQPRPVAPVVAQAAPAPQPISAPLGMIVGANTLDAAQIDAILAGYNSPAQGTGAAWVDAGNRYGIDATYAVAFFIHESSAGTNPAWAGWKGDGTSTHNVGNIICAGYATCYGRFRDYPDWQAGIADWFRLIRSEYIDGRGLQTVADIIPVYAPASENDVGGYVAAVEGLVSGWRGQASNAAQAFLPIGADDCGWNATVALQANGGALQDVTIPPGAAWSFNATMGDPAAINYRACAGVPGGYWCDLAARYLQVGRALGLAPEYEHHGLQLAGVAWEDSIAIWNVGGQPGSAGEAQDLVLTNPTPYTARMRVEQADGGVTIVGWME